MTRMTGIAGRRAALPAPLDDPKIAHVGKPI
jgi:hypothetical protein